MHIRRTAAVVTTGLLAALAVAVPSTAETNTNTSWLAVSGDQLVFDADDGSHGREVWSSDLTGSGTHLLLDTDPDPSSDLDSSYEGTSVDGGPVYFVVEDDGYTIWRTDGTMAGTNSVLTPGDGIDEILAVPGGVAYVDGVSTLWFVADGGTTPVELHDAAGTDLALAHSGFLFVEDGTDDVWISDGTLAGTHELGATNDGLGGSAPALTRTYLWAGDDAWVTTGAPGNLQQVTGVDEDLRDSQAVLGDLLVGAMNGPDGSEPYVLDGTTATPLADIDPGPEGSAPTGFATIGETVVFIASPDSGTTSQLWRTDATPGGTELVTTLAESTDNNDHGGAGTGTFAVLAPKDTTHDVIVTDGTPAGTFAATPGPGSPGTDRTTPVVLGDRIAFIATADDESGLEPWVSDGTVAGTHRITEVHPGPSIDDVVVTDTLVYFMADTPAEGPSVWVVDRADPLGSEPVLVATGISAIIGALGDDLVWRDGFDYLVHDASLQQVSEATGGPSFTPASTIMADSGLYLVRSGLQAVYYIDLASGAPYTIEERLSETANGIEDIAAGFSAAGAGLGDDLVFYADDDVSSSSDGKVWHYDESTDTLTALTSSGDLSRGINFLPDPANGVVYFEGQSSQPNTATDSVWVTDGTPAGTDYLAVDPNLDVQAPALAHDGSLVVPAQLGPANNTNVFAIADPLGTPSLTQWSDTASESGSTTNHIETVVPLRIGGDRHALAIVEDYTVGLYTLALVDPSGPDTYFTEVTDPDDVTRVTVGANTRAAFTADDGVSGRELWGFDPLTESISLAADMVPGAIGGVPSDLARGSLWFASGSDSGARDLWLQPTPAAAPVNVTAPTAVDDDATTDENAAVVVDLLDNDTARTGTLRLEWADGAAHGTVTANPGAGTATYTPDPGFFGTDAFTYRISDDLSVAQATVAVTVEELPPPVPADDAVDTAEDTAVTIDVLDNDAAGAGAPGPLALVSVTSPANGTATVSNGMVTYTPGAFFSGTDTFDYTLSDGRKERTATVTVTVSEEAATVERIQGDSRAETAVAVAGVSHADGADTVLLARQDAYPDALAGAPLARALDAPILLTRKDELLDVVGAAITDLGASRVVLLGGEGALTAEVAAAVADLAGVTNVDRIGGASRFTTSALIAAELPGSPTTAYVTEGSNADPARGWPDALSVSPLAASSGTPILLVTRDVLPDDTATALTDLGITEVTVVGGEAAVSTTVDDAISAAGVTLTPRLSGPSRYATSVAVAEAAVDAGAHPGLVWFATGLNFPDALVAGPAVAVDGGVMMLVHGRDADRSPESIGWLDAHADDPVERVRILGGPGAVAAEVEAVINAKLA